MCIELSTPKQKPRPAQRGAPDSAAPPPKRLKRKRGPSADQRRAARADRDRRAREAEAIERELERSSVRPEPKSRLSQAERNRRRKTKQAARAEKIRRRRATRPQRRSPSSTSLPSIEQLVREFEAGTLPRPEWDHTAHMLVALAYAHGRRSEAYTLLRAGIRRYNSASGFVETPTRGYHETITRAWFHLVLHFLDLFDDGQRDVQQLGHELARTFRRDDLFLYYSRERLLAPTARHGWVEPDLAPLPELEPLTPQDRRWAEAQALSRDPERPRSAAGRAAILKTVSV